MLNPKNEFLVKCLKDELVNSGTHPNRIKIVVGTIKKLFGDESRSITELNRDDIIQSIVTYCALKYQENDSLDMGTIGTTVGIVKMLGRVDDVLPNPNLVKSLTAKDITSRLSCRVTNKSAATAARVRRREGVSRKKQETPEITVRRETKKQEYDLVDILKAAQDAGTSDVVQAKFLAELLTSK